MPQGKIKPKVKVPQASQKKARQKKVKGPKKGGKGVNVSFGDAEYSLTEFEVCLATFALRHSMTVSPNTS